MRHPRGGELGRAWYDEGPLQRGGSGVRTRVEEKKKRKVEAGRGFHRTKKNVKEGVTQRQEPVIEGSSVEKRASYAAGRPCRNEIGLVARDSQGDVFWQSVRIKLDM